MKELEEAIKKINHNEESVQVGDDDGAPNRWRCFPWCHRCALERSLKSLILEGRE